MAKAKVTIEALTQMANILRQSADDIMTTKEQMDNALHSFPWDDPIGRTFIIRYEDDFKPLKERLIPNIEDYIQYLIKEGAIVSEYSGESAGGFGIGGAMGIGVGIAGAVGVGTMGVGVGIAGAAFAGSFGISSADRKENVESNNQILSSGFKDVGFESKVANMSEDALKQLDQTYKEYGDLSRMAAYSYRDGDSLPEGWEDLGQNDSNIRQIIEEIGQQGGDSSGLKFSVLKKSGEDKYVISFAGTDFPKDWKSKSQIIEFGKDAWSDGAGMISQDEKQIALAKQAVYRLRKDAGIPLDNMEFTGHSLGGRLAAEMSVQYARPATTFNAAGVSEETRKQYEYLMTHSKNHYTGVRNVVTEHDFLTNLQSMGSGAKNEYIAALPKEEIKIIHETISGTLSSTEGKVAKKALDYAGPLGTGTSRVIDGVDKAFTWADRFNEYYNRDYRALGGTVVLPDGKNGISGEAHGINFVSDLLYRRHDTIENRLNTIEQWKRTPPSWNENTSIPLPKHEIWE